MQTKPFDLEAAKRGEAICRVDGAPMTFIAYAASAQANQCVSAHDALGVVHLFAHDGASDMPTDPLCMVVKMRTVWVGLFNHEGPWTVIGRHFDSEGAAKEFFKTADVGRRTFIAYASFEVAV